MSLVAVITKATTTLGGFVNIEIAAVLSLDFASKERLEAEAEEYISRNLRNPRESNEIQSVEWQVSVQEVINIEKRVYHGRTYLDQAG